MSTVKINYSKLESAARQSSQVASSLRTYADAVPRTINSPLSSLAGGASGYTNDAAGLAAQKITSLRQRASKYDRLGRSASTFIANAKSADRQVKTRIVRVADKRAESLNFWQKISYAFYKFFNGAFGDSKIGAIVKSVADAASAAHEWGERIKNKIVDYFKHGDGRYILGIAAGVVAALVAITGAILSFPASGVIAIIGAIAAVVAMVVAVADAVAIFDGNRKALNGDDTEPGVARYYGNTSSVSDWARKNTYNADIQNAASVFDTVGKIAGIISSACGLFTKTLADGTKIFGGSTADGALKTLKDNLLKQIGIRESTKTASGYEFNLGNLFGFKGLDMDMPQGFWRSIQFTNDTISGVKNIIASINAALTIDGKSAIKDIAAGISITGDMFPAFNKASDLISKGMTRMSNLFAGGTPVREVSGRL